ncbi:hypothetical protein RhiirC2_871798 [Rhizophagus irregularis]|uniref:DUF8211 domain-containing protein n=1 Tax=Rhizophagus irregularis TaxID=588596 RepID=A0A2N1M794_9GLOM|nr:hypothetical protein RhiirC2_871798 [Rhizophagus irregularis]
MSSTPINHYSTSQLLNFKFQILKQLTHFFSMQTVIPQRLQNKFFTLIRKKLLEHLDFIVSRAQKKDENNHMTKTFFNFSYKKYRYYFGIYLPCNHCHTVDPLSNTATACLIPTPFTMSLHRQACIIHHKQLTLYFTSKDNKIPDVSTSNTFKNFHATRLYNRWAKKKIHNNFSNRLGISFTTTYRTFSRNVITKKGLDYIYGKVYQNFSCTPSSFPKVKKRQEKRFDALTRHTFHNANLCADALMEDKLQAARHHVLLFQENQSITKPIKHLRYKKKFVAPLQGYYTFPLPFSKRKCTSVVTPSDLPHDVSSIVSPTIVDPTLKCKLKPLTVGSKAWLAHMGEIYNIHLENLQYDLDRKVAISQWDTTDEKGYLNDELQKMAIWIPITVSIKIKRMMTRIRIVLRWEFILFIWLSGFT